MPLYRAGVVEGSRAIRPWSITLDPSRPETRLGRGSGRYRGGILIIYRAQIWAVPVKFKLRINELFTRYRPDI